MVVRMQIYITNVLGYRTFNDKIIVLKTTKRWFNKLGIVKVRARGSELRLIDIIAIKKHISIY